MGKGWDGSKIAYDVEMWRHALRVLKPGGHLLAFSGTRTYHRMVCAIEDAGFEIRDQIGWAYGTGFPKSLDVSKAIDKMGAAEEQRRRRLAFTAWVRSTGITPRQIDEATGTNMGGHYTTAASQPAIMTREHLEACRHLLHKVPQWVEQEADIRSVESRNMAAREVLGRSANGIAGGSGMHAGEAGAYGFGAEFDITAPATEAARQWQGWGTALKPAWEPIVVARKPLVGTVAENVLAHGTGAINVDGCRVEAADKTPAPRGQYGSSAIGPTGHSGIRNGDSDHLGRWPANLIHDGSDEVLALFPQTKGQQGAVTGDEPSAKTLNAFGEFASRTPSEPRGDTGSAARFFYCAKASRSDRNDGVGGSNKPAVGTGATMSDRENADWAARNGNHHPTVKPTDLMRYLCRLVTPPGGLVLDPFTGSGSTGKAAVLEGFRFIGFELSAEYAEIARRRMRP